MRELINVHIKEASLRHSAPAIAEKAEQAEQRERDQTGGVRQGPTVGGAC